MSAVIRIKRRIDEEPLSAFVLNRKRQKVEDEQTILKFTGTLEKPDDLPEHMLKLTKEDAKELISKIPPVAPNRTERNRVQQKENAHNSRFKIVNCTRALEDEAASTPLTILDVEKADSKESETSKKDAKDETALDRFVYDVYVTTDQNQRIASDNLLDLDEYSVVEYVNDSFCMYRENSREDEDNESVDSNDENYFTNDYPDEDDFQNDGYSENEEDIRRAVEDFDIDGDRELSSEDDFDDEEAGNKSSFVYSIDAEAVGFEDDLDYCNVGRYGEAYARYKKRYLRNSANNYLPTDYFDEEPEAEEFSD